LAALFAPPLARISRARIGKPLFELAPVGTSPLRWQFPVDTPGKRTVSRLHKSACWAWLVKSARTDVQNSAPMIAAA
jgi:hypothetical protein